jgi:hypothetical protein
MGEGGVTCYTVNKSQLLNRASITEFNRHMKVERFGLLEIAQRYYLAERGLDYIPFAQNPIWPQKAGSHTRSIWQAKVVKLPLNCL